MQRLLYLVIYPFLWLTSIMPLWLLYIKSDILYFIVYRVAGYRKKVVFSNLRLAFPDKDDAELKNIARKFYSHLCDIIFETIKNLTISEATARKRFKYGNLELLEELYAQDKSIILFCGHYASWEWSGILNRQNPYTGIAVYKELYNKSFDRMVRKMRSRFGASIVSNKKIVQRLYRLAKEGEKSMTLILADQTPKPGAFKHRDTFMDVNVPVFTGSEELAKKLNFASLYLKVRKVKRGYYSASFVLLEKESQDVPDYQITRKFLDEIEKQIEDAPQYYLWSHNRWKLRN